MTTATLPSAADVVSNPACLHPHPRRCSCARGDDGNRLTGIDHVQGGTTTLAYVDYTLDAVGNRTERKDDEGTHTPTPTVMCGWFEAQV